MSELELDDSFFSCSSTSLTDNDFASAFSDESVHLCDQLLTKFNCYNGNLNIVHINAQSVPAHYADLLLSFDSNVVDAILISETFLKPSLASSQYLLPGYSILRNDRVGKSCGGVAIYLRDDINYKVIDQSPSLYSNFAEHLFIEIYLRHVKILLGVYYSPSLHIDYFLSLETKLSQFLPLYDHSILLGDFNTCLLKNDSRSAKLQSLTSALNLHILPLSATHHSPNCTPSLLDLILVSDINNVASHGQLSASFSYHDLIFLSYKIRRPKRKPSFKFLRSFKNINLEQLKQDVDNIDWSQVYGNDNLDEKLCAFNSMIIQLFDKHAPLRRIKVKHLPAPWLSQSIKKIMAKRDKAKRLFKKFPTDENLSLYKKLRNHCSKMCRNAKRQFIHSSLANSNSTQIWKFLKTLGVGKIINEENVSFDLNEINKHFSHVNLSLDTSVKSSTISFLSNLSKPACDPFVFEEVSEADVEKCLSVINTKAVGSDNLSIQMIKPIAGEILPVITHIINHSLSTNSFPSIWKKGFVIPLPKISNPSSLSQFRPISILPVLSKILENLVHKQLSFFLTTNNLLSRFQSGFRPGHSTTSALIKVSDDIRWAMDNKLLTALVLLDFSSAFNCVDYDILLGILMSLNISSSVISWFTSYLKGRSQCVRHGDNTSNWCDLTAGVPQGGVLSPLLFSVFINALTKVLTTHFHLYADDLQIYTHFKTSEASNAINLINLNLQNISNWAKSFGLLVNPVKSQTLIIGSSYMLNSLKYVPDVTYNNNIIPFSTTAKNLGIIFDSNMSWTSHINSVSKRVYYSFHTLKRLQFFLPHNTKITLAQTLLLPLIDYADICYLDATEELLNKLERLQNLCIRFIFGLRKYDHVSEYRAQLQWLSIRRRRDLHIVSYLFSLLFYPLSPPYLCERFEFLVPRDKECRTIKSLLLKIPPHNTSRYGNSFTVKAVELWNALPHEIRDSPSLEVFKRRAKKYYLSL